MYELIEELEEMKQLIWNDDDYYEMGFNSGIDSAIELIKCKLTDNDKGEIIWKELKRN